jgi:hypothetical protein
MCVIRVRMRSALALENIFTTIKNYETIINCSDKNTKYEVRETAKFVINYQC